MVGTWNYTVTKVRPKGSGSHPTNSSTRVDPRAAGCDSQQMEQNGSTARFACERAQVTRSDARRLLPRIWVTDASPRLFPCPCATHLEDLANFRPLEDGAARSRGLFGALIDCGTRLATLHGSGAPESRAAARIRLLGESLKKTFARGRRERTPAAVELAERTGARLVLPSQLQLGGRN